jgi:predicted lipoprotein with Yx(FWY)xxD motif
MKHHRTAVFSGAVAITSFFGLGAGALAGAAAAPSHSSPASGASSAPSMKTLIRLQSLAKPATLHTASATVNGRTEAILVNAKGFPLYYFQGDTAKKSLVTGELARLWPALVSAKPTATGTPGKLTALKEVNGHQVAYNGHFLYTFIDDSPGHVTGQGVSNFFVATPRLKAIGTTVKVTTPAPSSGVGYGY